MGFDRHLSALLQGLSFPEHYTSTALPINTLNTVVQDRRQVTDILPSESSSTIDGIIPRRSMNTRSRLSVYDISSSVQSNDSRTVADTSRIANISANVTNISDVPIISDGTHTNYASVENGAHSISLGIGNSGPQISMTNANADFASNSIDMQDAGDSIVNTSVSVAGIPGEHLTNQSIFQSREPANMIIPFQDNESSDLNLASGSVRNIPQQSVQVRESVSLIDFFVIWAMTTKTSLCSSVGLPFGQSVHPFVS